MEKPLAERRFFSMDKLPGLCERLNAHIGIVTVPGARRRRYAMLWFPAGVLAIWNFASAHLVVPEGILVHHENMAASLAALSQHLREQIKKI